MVGFSIVGLAPGARVEVIATVSSETVDPNPANNQNTGTFIVGGLVAPTGGPSPILVDVATAVLWAGIAVVFITRRRGTSHQHPAG